MRWARVYGVAAWPGAFAAVVAVIFLACPAARAVEGWSYLPDRLVLANACDVLAQAHSHPVQASALLLGRWRMTRDT